MVLADYSFLELLWWMIAFFAFVIWFWLLISIFADIFRRRDIGGGAKTLWIIFVIIFPFIGVFTYLISQHDGMTERSTKQAETQRTATDDYIKSVAGSGGGGAASEIEKAKGLLDSGAITQAEYDSIKAKALAQS